MYERFRYEVNMFNSRVTGEKLNKQEEAKCIAAHLDACAKYLTNYYVMEMSSIHLNRLLHASDFNSDTESIVKKILSLLIDGSGEKDFIFRLYGLLLDTFSSQTPESSYKEYKRMFFANIGKLSRDEVSFHFHHLVSFCILKMRSNQLDKRYGIELFNLYKVMVRKELYKNSKTEYLPHIQFRNILLHSLRMEEYDWAYRFIQENWRKVHPADRDNMLNYGLAVYYYTTGKYDEALVHLNKFEVEDFIYYFDVKANMLKVYFELNYPDSALCMIKSLKETLRKNGLISGERKKRYKSFLHYAGKMFHLQLEHKRAEPAGFVRKNLLQEDNVLYKDWLLDKFELLEKEMGTKIKRLRQLTDDPK